MHRLETSGTPRSGSNGRAGTRIGSAAHARYVRRMGLLGETVRLTHYGRKSGKPYDVTIWFVKLDGTTWIGSLSSERGWVRNLRATGKAALDFGDGPRPVRAVWV